jgi:hypothetical protein
MEGQFSIGRASIIFSQVLWLRGTTLTLSALRPTTPPLILTCHTQMPQSIDSCTLYSMVSFIKLLSSTIVISLYVNCAQQMRLDFVVAITYIMNRKNKE